MPILDIQADQSKMNSMNLSNLTPSQLRKAASIKERIGALERDLAQLLGTNDVAVSQRAPKRRKMSRAAIARIRAGQKARWARQKGQAAKVRKRRKMSPAARERLAAVARARWKKVKSEGRTAL